MDYAGRIAVLLESFLNRVSVCFLEKIVRVVLLTGTCGVDDVPSDAAAFLLAPPFGGLTDLHKPYALSKNG